jgi:hypothetical protein
MKRARILELLLYLAIILLALAALALVFNAPPDFVKTKVVYGGF